MPRAWIPPMSADPQETKSQAVLSSCSKQIRECLEAARAGTELSFEQGLLLATVDGASSFQTFSDLLRSEEHTSELQSPDHLVCRLLLEKKKKYEIELRP